LYLASVGAALFRNVNKLFGWSPELTRRTVELLLKKEVLVRCSHPRDAGEWLALPGLLK